MQCVLYEWRNLPKQHGYSPAQLMFGRSQQLLLPQPAGAFSPIDVVEAAAAMDKKFETAAAHYDRDKVSLPAFRPGQRVWMQYGKSKKWDRQGEIIDVRPDGLSYLVDFEGKVIVRGRALLKPVFESRDGQDQGHVDQAAREFSSSPDIHSSSSDAHSSPRRSKRLQQKCLSLPVPALTATATPPSSGSSRGCNECIDNRRRTPRTRLMSPPEGFPLLISSGRPSPLEPPRSLCAPSCSSLSSSVAGYGQKTLGGKRQDTPSSRMSCVAPQAGQTPFQSPTSVPLVQDLPGPPLLPPRPQTSGYAPPLGGPPFPRPISFRPPPSTGFRSCTIPSSRQSFTMGDTIPSASVGFLAAAGTSRSARSLSPTYPGLSWSSRNRGSPSLTPLQTSSSAGLRGPLIPSVNPPLRLPVQPPLSPLPPSATVLPVPSHARVLAGPLTQTPSSPRLPCGLLYTRRVLL